MDEERPQPRQDIMAGADLSRLSVDEIRARINLLQAEIVRLETALEQKQASLAAANAAFRL